MPASKNFIPPNPATEAQQHKLRTLWLEALLTLCPVNKLTKPEKLAIFDRTLIEWARPEPFLGRAVRFNFRPETTTRGRATYVWINLDLDSWHRVEVIDALAYAAACAYNWNCHGVSDPESVQVKQTCWLTGCAPSPSGSPDERSRLVYFRHAIPDPNPMNAGEIVLDSPLWAKHDSRPFCALCNGPIPTGGSTRKTGLHDNCLDYAYTVMLPQLAAEQATAKQEEAV